MPGKRLLVISLDIDDDLGQKARVRGPVVGRKKVLEAASKLGIADPEDSDVNTLFESVRLSDSLKKENDVEVAALTGSKKLGYAADSNIVKQLEKVTHDFKPEACVLVSDGASDERVLPLIQSRIKIDSVKTVTVKQTKELEKTYFVILEKLRDPHFARIVFGIPGIALLLYFLMGDLGIRIFVGLLGAYLIIKGAGIEDFVLRKTADTRFSVSNARFIFYFAAAPLFIAALWLAVSKFSAMQHAGETNVAKLAAWSLKDLLLLLPSAVLLLIAGSVLGALNEKKNYEMPKYAIYVALVFLFWLIFNNAADWVLGTLAFSDLFYSILLGVVAVYLLFRLAKEFKTRFIADMHLEGKEVYTEIGSFVGKVASFDKDKDSIIIKTETGQRFDLDFDHISNIGDSIIVRY
ncbi:Uncharacterised protein [Candidatus Norongarragalina meridionalis]|nr:Uncharacterised protein [Candidatus Norongarragalina meridionalis]